MVQLEANYSKKLGLPGYSSHQYSVTLRTELTDLRQVDAESTRLYTLLQDCVDRDIQQTGFLPKSGPATNGHQISKASNGQANHQGETWSCSDKQRALILKVIEEQQRDKQEIETLAQERFGKGVRQLNRIEASDLIDELVVFQTAGN